PVFLFSLLRASPRSSSFPYTTLFRSTELLDPRGAYRRVHARCPYLAGLQVSARLQPRCGRGNALRAVAIEAVHVRRLDRHRAERSEEHTSELQSPDHLVCRLLLEKKK